MPEAKLTVGDVKLWALHHNHVEVPHLQYAPARFAHQAERLGQHVVEGLSVADPRAQGGTQLAQLVVGTPLEIGLHLADLLDHRVEAFHLALVLGSEEPREDLVQQAFFLRFDARFPDAGRRTQWVEFRAGWRRAGCGRPCTAFKSNVQSG